MSEVDQNGIVAAIIPAGGLGNRFGHAQCKQFLELGHWPVLAHTLSKFDQTAAVDQVVIVVPRGYKTKVKRDIVKRFGIQKVDQIVIGGQNRQESVYKGFMALREEVDLVIVHDAVRPLVRIKTIEDTITAARKHGAAIAAVPTRDTLKEVRNDGIIRTLDRSCVWQAQTPQVFERSLLARALAAARKDGFVGTDESSLLERLGLPVKVVHGAADNIKITLPEDMVLAESLIETGHMENNMRIGSGYDVHALVPDRKLILGGVEINHTMGLGGHSDADVIVHALCDAILSAACLPDIGVQFPDTDPKWAGVDSLNLLKLSMAKAKAAGFRLAHADMTLMAEKPKIKDYVGQMVRTIAQALDLDTDCLNVKGTTTEGLGAMGREEGMAAWAVVLLEPQAGG